MPVVGPTLPPHLQGKRKRSDDEESADDKDEKVARTARSASPSSAQSPDADKRRRVVGPAPPPASLLERPEHAAVDDSGSESDASSDDDGYGPAPPSLEQKSVDYEKEARQRAARDELEALQQKPQREEWMLAPPNPEDWTARVDPTKLRNRKFQTGKGPKAPASKAGVDHGLWTETPEEKRQRLKDEVMGVKRPATAAAAPAGVKSVQQAQEAEETAKRIRDYNEQNRNKSLYEERRTTLPREEEDDPSKRAFDKEKDIRGGQQINHTKRKELLNRAKDFGSKFAGGNYL